MEPHLAPQQRRLQERHGGGVTTDRQPDGLHLCAVLCFEAVECRCMQVCSGRYHKDILAGEQLQMAGD